MPDLALERRGSKGQQHQRYRRWQREREPCGKHTACACAHEAKSHADLAARRTGQKLTQRHQIGISPVVEPATLFDHFRTEIAQMRDRPAE